MGVERDLSQHHNSHPTTVGGDEATSFDERLAELTDPPTIAAVKRAGPTRVPVDFLPGCIRAICRRRQRPSVCQTSVPLRGRRS